MQGRLGVKAAATREKILDTAETAVLQKSFGSVGINEVLKSASVPKGSFYHYFDSKESFGVELIRYAASRYAENLDQLLLPQADTAREDLLRFITFHIRYYEQNNFQLTCLVSKIASEASTISEEMRLSLDEIFQEWTEKFSNIIRRGHGDGSIPLNLGAEEMGQLLFSTWMGANTQVATLKSAAPFHSWLVTTQALLNDPPPLSELN
jgi:TetR/AcrR family transcriptional repressor of nem operon